MKCPHGVYNPDHPEPARYCQVCTPGSGGGIHVPVIPIYDLCPLCKGRNLVKNLFSPEATGYCLDCGFKYTQSEERIECP